MGALTYYRQGYVDLRVGILICIGFFLGTLLGAKLAIKLPDIILTKMFGTMMVVIGLKMILTK